MRHSNIPLLLAFLVTAVFAIPSASEAQHLRSRQPLQAGFRWLGQGWSAGYHHNNPGPNTDYYNPYTAHNSYLISQQPGYQAAYHQYRNRNRPTDPGVPYSVYAPTSDANRNWNSGHGQSIQPTFVPVDDEDEDGEDEADDDNDFVADDDIPEVTSDPDEPGSIRVDEDSEEDADFEESSFDDDGAFDEFDAEAGSGTKDSGSTLKRPGSDTETSGSGTKATKTGFSQPDPGSFEAMDFNSYLTN